MPDKPFNRPGPGETPGSSRGQSAAGGGEEAVGRMVPVKHEGALPWVQLRNAAYSPSIFRKMIGRMDPKAANGDLVGCMTATGMCSGRGC